MPHFKPERGFGLSPFVFLFIDFGEDAPVKRLRLTNHEIYAGDALDSFQVTDPFDQRSFPGPAGYQGDGR